MYCVCLNVLLYISVTHSDQCENILLIHTHYLFHYDHTVHRRNICHLIMNCSK
jgi:hypothetical protein